MSEQIKELTKTQEVLTQLQDYIQTNNLSITVDLVGSWLWIYGNDTKEHRNFIKSLGAKWSSKKEKWYFHEQPYFKATKKQFSYEEIKEFNGCIKVL